MNPLTVTWAPHIYTEWGWKNFQAWIHAGHDNYLMTPNGKVHRLLTRLAVENLLHPFQPFMIGQKVYAVKLAEKFNIPLIYGENEAEYGNLLEIQKLLIAIGRISLQGTRGKIHIGGTSIQELEADYGLASQDLQPYMPIDPSKETTKNIEVHYLGYYLKWHPQSCYYYAVEHGGFEAALKELRERIASTIV